MSHWPAWIMSIYSAFISINPTYILLVPLSVVAAAEVPVPNAWGVAAWGMRGCGVGVACLLACLLASLLVLLLVVSCDAADGGDGGGSARLLADVCVLVRG
ncbi:uncharacterized protein K452DRAFT_92304 [Aplosporella prunicola CBS 121167]|uniref:Uncharacterized protein n=1 Tax=Aplosporella prunicola CBS 121167 TaxID=1176127 RepID=A0A6A6B4L8_9PEZI|nr:uncharacterized protein K452DRAFT_92304 [Aplosporella prunicola CBS 121167]KAF2138343.1 hypothetical protein K452DRAFT_92304 [Aplosporella prunicola CBS 121167]